MGLQERLRRTCAPSTTHAALHNAPAAHPPAQSFSTPVPALCRHRRGECVLGREARRGGHGAGGGGGEARAAPLWELAPPQLSPPPPPPAVRPPTHLCGAREGVSRCPGARRGAAAAVGGCVGRAATAAAIADATAAATATAATVAAAHPADSNRLSPKGASPEAGGRYKRDARCEMQGIVGGKRGQWPATRRASIRAN